MSTLRSALADYWASRFEMVGVLCLILGMAFFLLLFIVHRDMIFGLQAVSPTGNLQDYSAFYAAATAPRGEAGALYDAAFFQARMEVPNSLLWLYPPTMLLVLAPFGALSYGAAKLAWIGLSAAAVIATAWHASRGNKLLTAAAMISPAVFTALYTGQLSLIFASAAAIGFLSAKSRPILAGLCFGFLTLKPQLGLLVPFFLIFTGAWRTFFVATATAFGLMLASVLVYGVGPWLDFFASVTGGTHAEFVHLTEQSARYTAAEALRILGWRDVNIVAVSALILALSIYLLRQLVLAGADRLSLASMALLLTTASAPYLWPYDWMLVAFAIVIIAAQRTYLSPFSVFALTVSWFVCVSVFFSGTTQIAAALAWPAVTVAALAIWWEFMRRANTGNAATNLQPLSA